MQVLKPVPDVRGFTLMEVLIAVTLFAFAAAGSYRIFSMGIQIWKRVTQASKVERQVILACEKMSRDFREILRVEPPSEAGLTSLQKDFEYSGKSNEFSFPAVLSPGPGVRGGPVRITYAFDSVRGALCKKVETRSDLFRNNNPPCVSVASGILRVKFRYRLQSGIAGSYDWYDEWDGKEGLPYAVQVTVSLKQAKGGRLWKDIIKTVILPAGGKPEEAA